MNGLDIRTDLAQNQIPAQNTDQETTVVKDGKTLVRVSALDFSEGMFVDAELYVKLGDSFILLCSNSTLSKELINKINDFELTGDSLFIEQNYYNRMGKRHYQPIRANEAVQKLETEYNRLKADTAELYRFIGRNRRIPWEQEAKLITGIDTELEQTQAPFILQCICALRSPNEYLFAHCINVAMLNGLIGKWLGKDNDEQKRLINIGLLHDIGKLRIPAQILDKPSRLTAAEYEIVKQHPLYGEQLLIRSSVTDRVLLKAVRGHHEQMNGRGYPDGLSADEIHIYARITAISDIFDAMVAKRSYKRASSPFEVLEQFANDRFSHLDIHLVNLFVDRISLELAGIGTQLSDGRVGRVLYLNREQLAFPIVEVDGQTVITNKNLYCVSLLQG